MQSDGAPRKEPAQDGRVMAEWKCESRNVDSRRDRGQNVTLGRARHASSGIVFESSTSESFQEIAHAKTHAISGAIRRRRYSVMQKRAEKNKKNQKDLEINTCDT